MPRLDALMAASALVVLSCRRDRRDFDAPPPGGALSATTQDRVPTIAPRESPYRANPWGISQGQTLYQWFNCTGCHAQGGGAMGPPLADEKWRYGGDAEQIFTSIEKGRPNGMPAFGGRVASDQIWQLVSYVQTLSGRVPQDVAPSRADRMQATEPASMTHPLPLTSEADGAP